jgi:hypothetical protein
MSYCVSSVVLCRHACRDPENVEVAQSYRRVREAVFAFQPQQQELPEGLEEDDDDHSDDDDDSDSDDGGEPDAKPTADADGRITLRILKGNLGYGIDITEDAQATGFANFEGNPAKAAGVPIPSKIVSVNGVEVHSKRDVMSALRNHTDDVPAEFIFLAEAAAPAPAPAAAASSSAGNGACSDPEKAALLQVRIAAATSSSPASMCLCRRFLPCP